MRDAQLINGFVKLAWLSLLLCVAGFWTSEAHAAESRRIILLDDSGQPIRSVVVKFRGTNKTYQFGCDKPGDELDEGDESSIENGNACELELDVWAGNGGAGSYEPQFDSDRGIVTLKVNPQFQDCFQVSLKHHKNGSVREFFVPEESSEKLCPTHTFRVDRRVQRFHVLVRGEGALEGDIHVRSDQGDTVATPVVNPTERSIDFEFRFKKPPEAGIDDTRIELHSKDHHPIIVSAPRREVMSEPERWILEVHPPTHIFQTLRIHLPRSRAPLPERMQAFVEYPAGEEPEEYMREAVSSPVGCGTSPCRLPCKPLETSTDTGQPFEDTSALAASCPIPPDKEVRIVLEDASKTYEDDIKCTPTDGICEAEHFFKRPRSTRMQIRLNDRNEAFVCQRLGVSYIFIEKLDASNEVVATAKVEIGRQNPWFENARHTAGSKAYCDNGYLTIDARDFADVRADNRYNVLIYGDYSSHPRQRSALVVASNISRSEWLAPNYDVDDFQPNRFGLDFRFYSGFSTPSSKLITEEGKQYNLGADPFFGLMLNPQMYVTDVNIPIQMIIGLEFDRVSQLTIPLDGPLQDNQVWRRRGLLGAGIGLPSIPLTSKLRVNSEFQLAWAPEKPFPRGAIRPEDLLALMFGAHFTIDIIPKHADRLGFFYGVDVFYGSRTKFAFESRGQGEAKWRLHASFGLIVALYRQGRLFVRSGSP